MTDTDTASVPSTRIEELKQQLADEFEQLITATESRVEDLDRQINALTEQRKSTADELRNYRRDLERLTGEKPDRPTSKSDGEFECRVPGCGKSYPTMNGLKIHTGRSHKRDRIAPKAPSSPNESSVSTRSVYRCGELGAGAAGDPCGHEVKSLADLSHHTLTAHRRQPTPAEKILVTPDR